MGFEFWKYNFMSIEYNQDFIDSDLKLFWNVDFIARFAWFLGCELKKSSLNKTIKLNIQVWDKVKVLDISYDQAHKFAMKFLNFIKQENPEEFDWFLDLQTKTI